MLFAAGWRRRWRSGPGRRRTRLTSCQSSGARTSALAIPARWRISSTKFPRPSFLFPWKALEGTEQPCKLCLVMCSPLDPVCRSGPTLSSPRPEDESGSG
jgi:hypothetical protein